MNAGKNEEFVLILIGVLIGVFMEFEEEISLRPTITVTSLVSTQ